MIPKVKFDISIELDIQMTRSFLSWGSVGGVDFSEGIYNPNPDLRTVDIDSDKDIHAYFERVYKEKESDFQKVIEWNQNHWGKIESDFTIRIVDLFKGHEFPEGKYVGYLSINDCNPRFLHDKSFMMYYNAKTPNRTISHELTHFIFYDYTALKHPSIFGDKDPNTGAYWSFAELFNNVILSLPEFVELLNNYGDGAYPDHEKHYAPLVRIWEDTKDIDEFILSGFAYLEKNLHPGLIT